LQGYASFQLAEVLGAQGDLAGAETKFQESARIRHEIQETATEAESRLAMGRLQLEKQGAKSAEESARAAIAEFPKAKSADTAGMGFSLLALALSRKGKFWEAQHFWRESRNLLRATVDPAARLQVESDSAFVAGLSRLAGKPPVGNEIGRALKDMEAVR